MAFLSSSINLLRCACRTEMQLASSLARSAPLKTPSLRASFSSSSVVSADSSSSSSSSRPTSIPFPKSSSSGKTRPPFVAPESYNDLPQPRVESPLTTKAKEGSALASSLPISGIFGTKRAEIRKAKQQGLQYKEAGRETKEKDALPKVYSVARPVKPAESRTLEVRSGEDFARQYRRLMSGVINFNNVKHELRWQERYEKPKYKRQRLRSARHRRRFANEVGIRVAAVLRARSQGM